VAVVGLGGVGSWAVEALARCGVAELVLIDLDHVAESNINRQVQALGSTLGMAQGAGAAHARIVRHPSRLPGACDRGVRVGRQLARAAALPVDAVIDACDQSHAKLALARWALDSGSAYACVGAAGGKREAQRVEVADLVDVTHDPLLASLRQRLRKALALVGATDARRASTGDRALGVRCVFSRETVATPPDAACAPEDGLNCARLRLRGHGHCGLRPGGRWRGDAPARAASHWRLSYFMLECLELYRTAGNPGFRCSRVAG
jgi:tRNA A37 threonylcarbamoyladenosine dehydratase